MEYVSNPALEQSLGDYEYKEERDVDTWLTTHETDLRQCVMEIVVIRLEHRQCQNICSVNVFSDPSTSVRVLRSFLDSLSYLMLFNKR